MANPLYGPHFICCRQFPDRINNTRNNTRVLPIFLTHLFLNFFPQRYAAIRYCQSKTLPDYLTRGMLDIGVNFLTFEPLQPETLNALSKTIKKTLGAHR